MFGSMVADGDDAGAELAAAAVEALRSTGPVRAATDAVELQSIATLVHVRRSQARADCPAVDLELVDRCTAQEVSLALTVSPVVARDRMEFALELVDRRAATFRALREGRVDVVRARRICDGLRTLAPRRIPVSTLTTVDAVPAGTVDAGTADAGTVDAGTADAGTVDAGTVESGSADAGTVDVVDLVEAEVLRPGSVPLLADLRPGRPAGDLTPGQLTARLARLTMRADPAGSRARTARADERRGCSLRTLPDGMALLSVTGRGELLSAAFARIDTAARALVPPTRVKAGDRADRADGADAVDMAEMAHAAGPRAGVDAARTLDQARVDVLLASLLGHGDDLSSAAGVTVELALVAPAGTVLAGGDEPGELAGYGPVPAPLVRELAADARWRRWSADPGTGHVTDVGRRTYRPSAAVADLVRGRDRTCRFPTCRRRATACDLDHVTPFPHGDTCRDNLATLCRLHHLCKHRGGFSLSLAEDGTTTWTTPTGGTVTTQPPSWGRPGRLREPGSTRRAPASEEYDDRPGYDHPPGPEPPEPREPLVADPDPPPF